MAKAAGKVKKVVSCNVCEQSFQYEAGDDNELDGLVQERVDWVRAHADETDHQNFTVKFGE